jgi:hypothetical protein
MLFSIRTFPEEVAVRLPPPQDPDAEVFATGAILIGPGKHYGALSYEDLRSLGDGRWELPGDPSTWTPAKARRIEIRLPEPDSDPAEAASDPIATT